MLAINIMTTSLPSQSIQPYSDKLQLTAIIDLGTNTFNLLIAEVDAHAKAFKVVYSAKEAVKLGEGSLVDGLIRPAAMQRAQTALTGYMQEISRIGCTHVLATGTSAMRDSRNAGDLVQWAEEHLNLNIRIISGDEEAQLITEGVRLAVGLGEKPSLIMDIGGGSTEFIIANATEVFWQKSYQLGISRLRQVLRPNDPVTPSDLSAFDSYLRKELGDLIHKTRENQVSQLIGSSGSFDSFMEMLWASKGTPREAKEIRTDTFNASELSVLNDTLLSMDMEARRKIPGLVEMRVDTIHLASYMVQWVLRECRLTETVLSTYSLKEGMLHRIMQNVGTSALSLGQ